MAWSGAGWVATATEVATLEGAVTRLSTLVVGVVGGVVLLGGLVVAWVTVRRVRGRE